MNKIIEDQLNKVIYADLSNVSEDGLTYHISKIIKKVLIKNHSYLIELDDSLLVDNPSSILQTNYNNNKHPTYKYMKVEVDDVLGKVVHVSGVGYDKEKNQNLLMWSGYLTTKDINILEEL